MKSNYVRWAKDSEVRTAYEQYTKRHGQLTEARNVAHDRADRAAAHALYGRAKDSYDALQTAREYAGDVFNAQFRPPPMITSVVEADKISYWHRRQQVAMAPAAANVDEPRQLSGPAKVFDFFARQFSAKVPKSLIVVALAMIIAGAVAGATALLTLGLVASGVFVARPVVAAANRVIARALHRSARRHKENDFTQKVDDVRSQYPDVAEADTALKQGQRMVAKIADWFRREETPETVDELSSLMQDITTPLHGLGRERSEAADWRDSFATWRLAIERAQSAQDGLSEAIGQTATPPIIDGLGKAIGGAQPPGTTMVLSPVK